MEKKAFAVYALQKIDYYFHNAKFIISTDHKPRQYILKSPLHKKGISNVGP